MTPRFLASVVSPEEALIAVAGGADIIDAKNPAEGALGALPVATVARIRHILPAGIDVSATIGDLPAEAGPLVNAARAMAASGCDIIKIGFFPGGDARAAIAALGAAPGLTARRVGLLLADRDPDFSLIAAMADAGFAGVMLDTASKAAAALPDLLTSVQLSEFIALAHAGGLFAGIAGSLRLSHVPTLLRLKPDVLGFRGALCENGQRTGPLSATAVRAVRAQMDRHVPLRA